MNKGTLAQEKKGIRQAVRHTRRAMRAGRSNLAFALASALLVFAAQAHAQAVTSPVAPSAAPAATRDGPVVGAALQTSTLGEAQIESLLKMVQDAQAPDRGLPIDIFRERVLNAVLVHPDVLALRASRAGAIEATRESAAARLPQIGARAEISDHHLGRSTINGTPHRTYESASAGLTLSQTVYDFGAIDATVLASTERAAAVQARLDGRRDELSLRAVQAWFDVVRTRRLLSQLQLNQQSLENMVSYLTRRYDLGGGPISDVWRAQSRLADARASLATALTRVRNAEAGFRELFGAAPGVLDLPARPVVDRKAIIANTEALVRDYPAVRGAEASRRAAEQELELTLRRERPHLGLEMSAQRRDIAGRGEPGSDVSAALVLRYSFYTGGADQARAAQAAHRAVEAAEQVRGVALQVERALTQSLATEDNVAATLAARRDGVQLAVQALRAVREQFANRRGSLLDLLNAQEQLHAAGVGLTDAEIDEAVARWQVLYYSTAYWPLAAKAPPAR
jgi:outer membrane protein, adhesin transport system